MNAFRARQHAARGRVDLLPPEPANRSRMSGRKPQRREIVDADFIVIDRTSGTSNDNRRRPATTVRKNLALDLFLRALSGLARLGEYGLQRLPGRAFAGLVATAFLFVFAFAGGLSALQTALPLADDTGPLRITETMATVEDRNGMKVLTVYGRIENVTDTTHPIPLLDVRMASENTTARRQFAAGPAMLAPGSGEDFVFRLPHTGGKLPKVTLSFASQDAPAD